MANAAVHVGNNSGTHSRLLIHTRNTGQNLRDDLIVDGAQPRGYSFGSQLFLCLLPNQNNFISHADTGDSADIYHRLVHTNSPNQRRALATHQHLTPIGRRAPETIGIANGNHGDTHLCWRDKRTAIADTLTRRNIFDLRDLSFKDQGWLETSRQAYLVGWVQSIERNAWPDHVKTRLWQGECGSAVGC